MIESISLRGIGVISSAQLELGAGFTALTGETGAGKTMVLTALGLLLGDRADSSAVRRGEPQLYVEGRVLTRDEGLVARLEELGSDVSGGEILINRSVSADGRSRAAIGGASVPISTLSEIADQLVAVHGQAEQVRLRSTSLQRQALDAFAGNELTEALTTYQALYRQYRELESRLERMQSASESDAQRLAMLRAKADELSAAEIGSGELAELDEKINRLSNVEGLREVAQTAHQLLASEEGEAAVSLLSQARKLLDSASDSKLNSMAQLAAESSAIASELATELASFLTEIEADPELLQQLMGRKAELVGLERKYGATTDELLAELPRIQSEILDLDSSDEQLEKLEMQLEALLGQLGKSAGELTSLRTSAAARLSEEVGRELAGLAMAGSSLVVKISDLPDFETTGRDRVEFLLAAHPGAEPRPLGKGASGGELSRIMLAIELVLASGQQLPTMIFDEVDAGVGGAAAVELGRRLKELARSTQVIVVTHLPQVAAFADRQISVLKDSLGEITVSSVRHLTGPERERELARMLSGSPDSEVALSHARELLNSAN